MIIRKSMYSTFDGSDKSYQAGSKYKLVLSYASAPTWKQREERQKVGDNFYLIADNNNVLRFKVQTANIALIRTVAKKLTISFLLQVLSLGP